MKDMLGRTIGPGDFFLIPGGNVRYGGLVLEVGIILSTTEKRIKTLITRFDKIKLKPTTKTPTKVFKINTNRDLFLSTEDLGEAKCFYNNDAILRLKTAYDKYLNNLNYL